MTNFLLPVILAWIPSHVCIRGNEEVDMLAKEALGLNITPLKIPFYRSEEEYQYLYQG